MPEASSKTLPSAKSAKPGAIAAATETAQPESYEAGLRELERLLSDMESGQLPLDQLLQSYQRGAELLKYCRARLEAVENQVRLLEDGIAKPWNPPS